LCDNPLDFRKFFPGATMSLTPDDVKSIARLARLAIAEQDIPAYAKNLSSILEFVAQLDKADTTKVQTMAHPLV
jgi:aspartyl-tRNA(Asn)/glutamyl-tRNA(Gln) amidotransferase subunit C